ncbi:MAG: hypothetical protein M1816_001618 [Peltula sp. TS41687]|nr:MAG: hypothetical protein M1816_001618 [Peltula sp. TS41687]
MDPTNRYNDGILRNACGNVNVQRGSPKRTLLGISEVEGYGLFMGEPVKAKEYLGEYVGELVSTTEASRRGEIYQLQALSYLFSVNKGQDADATRAGNKFRFINHSARAQNCTPKVLFVNGVHRVAIFSTRNIRIGEELFFDYGPRYTKSLLSKEPKRQKSITKGTSIRRAETQASEKAAERRANLQTFSERKEQESGRRSAVVGRELSRPRDERTKRRSLRSRTRDQRSGSSTSRKPRGERNHTVTRERKRQKPLPVTKPASKHETREGTVRPHEFTVIASSTSETEEEDLSDNNSEGDGTLAEPDLVDAAAGSGHSSDEDYSEDDDETALEARRSQEGLGPSTVGAWPRVTRSGRTR